MKSVIFTLLALTAATAQAKTVKHETFVCEGIDKSKGYSLELRSKSNPNVEGKAIAYWARIDQPDGRGYDGLIFGYKEDVMLKLTPRRNDNVEISGTIFFDQNNQILTYRNGSTLKLEKLELTCDLR